MGCYVVWATLPALPDPVGSVVTSAPRSSRPPAPGAGRAQCSFRGSQLPETEAEAEGAAPANRPAPAPLPWLRCGANAQLSPEITQGWGWEQGGTETDPSSCPPVPQGAGSAEG